MKKFPVLLLALVMTAGLIAADDAADDDWFVGMFLANYVTTFYHTESGGFPGNEANAVLQTADGFMWFGGFTGLIRYDGKKFTSWNAVTPDNFTSSNVRTLYESGSSQGSSCLWIGTNDKGLFSFKNGVFTAYDKEAGVPSNMIRCIVERSDGMIFCGTSDGLFYLDGERNVTTVNLDTPAQPFIISIAADAHNNIYAVLNTGELLSLTADGRTIQYPFGTRFFAVYVSKTGRVIAGTQDGDVVIADFDGGRFTAPVVRQTPNLNISAFYEDSQGLIWITSETGLGFLDADFDYHHIGNPNGVGFYSGIIEDYQNGYWITATKGGVVKFSKSAFTDLNALYNFQTGSANAVVIDNGKTYIGTDRTLYILDEEGKPVYTDFSSLISGRVRGVFRDSRGSIWICTYSNMGVVRFIPPSPPQVGEYSYRYWTPADGLASERTRSFAELPNGVIAVGTTVGVSFIRDDAVISASEAFDTDIPLDLPAITILSLCATSDGTLYIGTDGIGVYAVNRDGVTRFTEEDGLTGGVILRLFVNQKTNGVWVSPSSGLCYIDENKKVSVIKKVPPYAFLDIMQYHNRLILLTTSFIIRADADSLLDPDAPFAPLIIGRSSGLSASINANAWNLIADGSELYFCSDGGVNIYNFESTLSAAIPHAGITGIDIDGQEHTDFSAVVPLRRDAFRLTFDLSYLSFGLLDNAEMYYKLDGQDAAKLPDERRLMPKTGSYDVSYTNLRGGNYTFMVWTEDSAGNMGKIIKVNLYKELKLMERPIVWAALTLLGVFAIALLFIMLSWRSRIKYKQLEEHSVILESMVKERTQELKEQTEIAVQANRAKTEFLATMSHELRTPLNAIIGFSEIELRNKQDGLSVGQSLSTGQQSSQNNIAHIYHSGSYLLEIINDILDIPKIESGNIDIDAAEYETAAMLGEVININLVRLASKPINFAVEIDADFPRTLTGDKLRVKQILNNLLSNAVKYTKEGEIRLTVNREETVISFSVLDTGIGIREEDMGKLFHSYTRLDTGMNRRTEGTGLGLVIAKKLIEMMGGSITVESEYGKGSCFTARIVQGVPYAEGIGDETASALRNLQYTAAVLPVEYPRLNLEVLVVDDVPENIELAVKMLASFGARADTATSGREAIEKIQSRQQPYDLIFMDHMMPQMDGIETTRKIREGGYGGVIVALTASAMRGMREFYLEEGFDDYLSKPINFDSLGEMLAKGKGVAKEKGKEKKEKSEEESGQAGSIAAEVEVRRLDMLNHYAVSFNAVKGIDTEHFDRFSALVETWALHENDEVRECALALAEAGRRQDAHTIREKLKPFCDILKEQEQKTSEKDREILHKLKQALLSGDGQNAETVLTELGAVSAGQENRRLYLRLYELFLTGETEKALKLIEKEGTL